MSDKPSWIGQLISAGAALVLPATANAQTVSGAKPLIATVTCNTYEDLPAGTKVTQEELDRAYPYVTQDTPLQSGNGYTFREVRGTAVYGDGSLHRSTEIQFYVPLKNDQIILPSETADACKRGYLTLPQRPDGKFWDLVTAEQFGKVAVEGVPLVFKGAPNTSVSFGEREPQSPAQSEWQTFIFKQRGLRPAPK